MTCFNFFQNIRVFQFWLDCAKIINTRVIALQHLQHQRLVFSCLLPFSSSNPFNLLLGGQWKPAFLELCTSKRLNALAHGTHPINQNRQKRQGSECSCTQRTNAMRYICTLIWSPPLSLPPLQQDLEEVKLPGMRLIPMMLLCVVASLTVVFVVVVLGFVVGATARAVDVCLAVAPW